jgi:predicted transcriptional regulator
MTETDTTLSLATRLATSYVGNNKVGRDELPALLANFHEALSKLERDEEVREPAVPINKSVKRNEILCLECGQGHKMLKRHLTTAHGLTPEEYRAQWGLAGNYPLVAPNYAKQRSELAKKIGLGRKPGAVRSKKPASKSIKSKARRKR